MGYENRLHGFLEMKFYLKSRSRSKAANLNLVISTLAKSWLIGPLNLSTPNVTLGAWE